MGSRTASLSAAMIVSTETWLPLEVDEAARDVRDDRLSCKGQKGCMGSSLVSRPNTDTVPGSSAAGLALVVTDAAWARGCDRVSATGGWRG
jgi:hypothetical protein